MEEVRSSSETEATGNTEHSPKRPASWFIPALIILILAVGALAFGLKKDKGQESMAMPVDMAEDHGTPGKSVNIDEAQPVPGSPAETETHGAMQTFTVQGSDFAFDVKEIRVKKGDHVQIVFKNTKGVHDWVIDAFQVRTKVIGAGKEETVMFVADQTGTFEYYCSVGNHRAMGMVGKLIVEE
ncbi:MAG: plastocyanin/azurin family copper-binding protein [Candidatus Moraniibacteriota bacterium]